MKKIIGMLSEIHLKKDLDKIVLSIKVDGEWIDVVEYSGMSFENNINIQDIERKIKAKKHEDYIFEKRNLFSKQGGL